MLSDTGWHLPTGILQEAGTLNLFLKATDSESGHVGEHRVNPELYRTAWEILSGMHSRVSISMAFAWWQVLWPVLSGHLPLPACLLFTLITMLVFSLATTLPSSCAHDAGMC